MWGEGTCLRIGVPLYSQGPRSLLLNEKQGKGKRQGQSYQSKGILFHTFCCFKAFYAFVKYQSKDFVKCRRWLQVEFCSNHIKSSKYTLLTFWVTIYHHRHYHHITNHHITTIVLITNHHITHHPHHHQVLNPFEQFRRMSNFIYLIMAVVQVIKIWRVRF